VESKGSAINHGQEGRPFFPAEVAVHLVKIACERPDDVGRSLSTWFCSELALQLIEDGVVESISTSTVQRILMSHKLKPWRTHMWMSVKSLRDEEFYRKVKFIIELYTLELADDEAVISIDEKTSLQPRTRTAKTKPALQGNIPNRVEHEYVRSGALQLFAGFDTRSGEVYGQLFDRKRQTEFIMFLEGLNAKYPPKFKKINLVMDNVSVHHGKQAKEWFANHPRFILHISQFIRLGSIK